MYESGILGLFALHGGAIPAGAAYAILIRLDDILFTIIGAALLMRFGAASLLRQEKPSHA